MRFLGRGEWHASLHEDADEEVLKALRGEPERVLLLTGEEVHVYPKGLEALLFIRNHDWVCSWLASWLELLRDDATHMTLAKTVGSPVATMDRIERELGIQLAICARVACQEGPGIDYNDANNFPDEWMDIDPIDIARIHRAFFKVNVSRFNQLPYVAGPRKSKDGKQDVRMSWSVFYSRAGKQLGEDPKTLMRDRSLAELLVQVQLAQPALEDELDA
jgi:hypothetical protein